MRVAVIGAGIAGLACANRLARSGYKTVLFDKGRGPGGRMSTRRVDLPDGRLHFDHGAQYLTARDPDFTAMIEGLERDGHAARWDAAGADAWVGTPGMNAIIKALAQPRNVHWGARVEQVEQSGTGWLISGEGFDAQSCDAAIVAVPAEQAASLLAPLDEQIAAQARATLSEPCWTVMAAFAAPLPISDDVLRHRGDIAWAARNAAKPGRDGPETWVVQANVPWSQAQLERSGEEVTRLLLAALAAEMGAPLPPLLYAAAHRWRYARTTSREAAPYWNPRLRLGVCGDWLGGARIEAAWLSGHRLAGTILTQIS